MSFTAITITHTFDTGSGAAAGTVVFELCCDMTNGTETHMAGETITATLNGSGALSQAIPATDDTGTTPAAPYGPLWRVDIRLTGAQARTQSYFISVPHATTPVDLFSLIPTLPQVT